MNSEKKLTISTVHWDVLQIIFQSLRDRVRLNVLATCRMFWIKRCRFLYYTQVDVMRVKHLPYFNNFCNVVLHGRNLVDLFPVGNWKPAKNIFPTSARHVSLKNITKTPTLERIMKTHGDLFVSCPMVTHVVLDHSGFLIRFLPTTITHLTIQHEYLTIAENDYISQLHLVSLKIISNHSCFDIFPATLRNLSIEYNNAFLAHTIAENSLPAGLETISLTGNIKLHENAIPASVKKIIFGKNFNLDVYLPPNIQECIVHTEADAKIILSRFPSISKVTFVTKKKSEPKPKNRRAKRPYRVPYEYTD